MSPHFTPFKAALAVALALSTTLAAHAQTASATASVSKLKIELIDLDPADGIAPGLTLSPADRVSQSASTFYSSSDRSLNDSDYRWGYGPLSTSVSSIEASGSSSADAGAGRWQAAGSYAKPVGNYVYLSSDSYGTFQFKLTRATRMIVTADASVSAVGDGSRNKSEAWASINGSFDDGLENQVIDSLSWAGTDADEQLGISMQTLYGSLYGWLSLSAGTRVTYDAARPVPEPATPAMLLAGVAVLGFCARRKARRAA